jgi:hypothetical protein
MPYAPQGVKGLDDDDDDDYEIKNNAFCGDHFHPSVRLPICLSVCDLISRTELIARFS